MVKCSSGSRIFECKHGEMQLRIQNIRPIFPAPLMITSILCKNTPKWGDFIYTPQSPQTPHFGVIYMRIAPHTPQCTSIAIPHNLSSCTSLHLIHLSASQTPQNGVISYIHPNHPKHPTLGWFIWGLNLYTTVHLNCHPSQSLILNPENFHFFLLGLSGGKG